MPRDPFGNPSTCWKLNHGHTAGECRFGLIIGLQWYDGPTLILQLQVAGWWCYATLRLWYSDRMWRRSGDRWQAECLAGEHQGVSLSISEPS